MPITGSPLPQRTLSKTADLVKQYRRERPKRYLQYNVRIDHTYTATGRLLRRSLRLQGTKYRIYAELNFKPRPVWVADNQQRMYEKVDSLPRR